MARPSDDRVRVRGILGEDDPVRCVEVLAGGGWLLASLIACPFHADVYAERIRRCIDEAVKDQER